VLFRRNGVRVEWEPQRLVIAGYTARDKKDLQRHIEELKEAGVPAPREVPAFFDMAPSLLTTDDHIWVVGGDTSGEAELVVVDVEGDWHVALGSDHTDRVVEATSIQKSKQLCAKPVSTELWSLESISGRWEDIELRSWVTVDGQERPYQVGSLGSLLDPEELLGVVEDRGYAGPNMALFCGTLPILDGGLAFGEAFRAELLNGITGERLRLEYRIQRLKGTEVD
jgi:hypothetical protein